MTALASPVNHTLDLSAATCMRVLDPCPHRCRRKRADVTAAPPSKAADWPGRDPDTYAPGNNDRSTTPSATATNDIPVVTA